MSIEELRGVRESWARVEAAEAALPLDLRLEDRVRVFDMLYQSCRSQLAATDELFGPLRQQQMSAFQARLRRLAEVERATETPDGVPGGG